MPGVLMLTIQTPFYDVTYLEILNLGIFFTKENIIKVSYLNNLKVNVEFKHPLIKFNLLFF